MWAFDPSRSCKKWNTRSFSGLGIGTEIHTKSVYFWMLHVTQTLDSHRCLWGYMDVVGIEYIISQSDHSSFSLSRTGPRTAFAHTSHININTLWNCCHSEVLGNYLCATIETTAWPFRAVRWSTSVVKRLERPCEPEG
jgi:hypothetical protein